MRMSECWILGKKSVDADSRMLMPEAEELITTAETSSKIPDIIKANKWKGKVKCWAGKSDRKEREGAA